VYIFAQSKRVPLLDRLFARPAALDPADREFFGDFAIDPETKMVDLAEIYGFPTTAEQAALTAAEFLSRRLQGAPEVGDRVTVGLVELIVRDRSESRAITRIGLAVEPSRAQQPRLPLFHTRREIARTVGRWLRRARRP
jgi:potassium/hydrogen antiporter